MLALDAAEDEDEGEELVGWRLLEEVPLTDVCHACAAPTVCIACDKCGLVAYCSAACRLLHIQVPNMCICRPHTISPISLNELPNVQF